MDEEDIPGLSDLAYGGFKVPSLMPAPRYDDVIQQPGVPIGVMPPTNRDKLARIKKSAPAPAQTASEAAREALARIQAGIEQNAPVGRGTVGTVAPEPLSQGRISQRFPTSKAPGTEDPLTQNLLINMNVLKQDPDKLQQAAEIIRTYPGVTKKMLDMNPEELVDAFRDSISGNLKALYDLMPPNEAQRAARWYHGAHRISQERAAETGVHPYASAGAYAALSPQMDWYKNVYLGDQVLRTLAKDPKVDAEMLRMARDAPTLGVYRQPENLDMLRSLEGRRIGNMTPEEQALAVRLYDETYGSRQYRKITPEGDYGDLVLTGKGEPAKPGWGSFTDIQKSLEAAQSGGDPNIISPLMGMKHKVRDFYNDIVAPVEAEKFGDVTIDTHQIAGGQFRPLSGADPEVATGLGSKPPSSAATGLQGLYPIYADATRNAAAERNVPVIAMQSVPWEGTRALFPADFKTASNKAVVDSIWRDYGSGKITADEARRRVVTAAGGFRPPSW
jgi:hypothetical protein